MKALIDNVISKHDTPNEIVSDRDSNYSSEILRQMNHVIVGNTLHEQAVTFSNKAFFTLIHHRFTIGIKLVV